MATAFDLPSSPTEGQEATLPSGTVVTWSGDNWIAKVDGALTPEEQLQLDTMNAIFGDWKDQVPTVSIISLSPVTLTVTATSGIDPNDWYVTIPGDVPVDQAFEWDWGDSTAYSTTKNASHTYSSEGTYTIRFRAQNHIGWSSWASQDITVTSVLTDPYWSSVVALMQGTTLTDRSSRAHSVIIDTGTPVMANGRVQLDGLSSLQLTDNVGDFGFTGSWTVEGQLRGVTAGAGTAVFLSNLNSSIGWEVYTRGGSNFNGGFWSSEGQATEPTTPPWVTDTLHDFAVTFDNASDTLRLYLDGVKIGQVVGGNTTYAPSTAGLYVGRESNGAPKHPTGEICFRITNGVARYVDDTYSPPAWPVPETGP